MVEINNQRKAFLDMLAWSEELITDVRKPEIMVVIVGDCYWLLRSPSQTCHAKPGTIQQAPDATGFFPVGGMPTASSLAWKTSLRKVRTLWHCSRLRSVALYLWLIVVISVRQSTVAAISGLHCRALVMVSFEHKADSLLKFKKQAEQSGNQTKSPRLSPFLVICIIICLSRAVNHYVIALPTKPSATKMPKLALANALNCGIRMRQRKCLLRSMQKYTKKFGDAKARKWCSAW